jgi:hypothetical protein
MAKRKTIKVKRGRKRNTRRNKKGGQPITPVEIENIMEQIRFVDENKDRFREIGIVPEDYLTKLQSIIDAEKLPEGMKSSEELGNVRLLAEQLDTIEKVLREESDAVDKEEREEGEKRKRKHIKKGTREN